MPRGPPYNEGREDAGREADIKRVVDGVSDSIDYQLRHLLGPARYHRFQVTLERACDDLDDASEDNVARILQDAERLVRDQDAELDELCAKLVR
jgi:hypothetical protein